MDQILIQQKYKAKLPTNLTTAAHPIHRWFNFIAGYSPEFVSDCIFAANLNSDSTIIDPFAGLSTTLVQSKHHRISSIGFEPHPFFYDLSKAKLNPPDTDLIFEIELILNNLEPYKGSLSEVWSESALTYLQKLIPETSLRILAQALKQEEGLTTKQKPIYRLIVSRILEYVSGSKTDGIYKAPTSTKRSVPYLDAVSRVIPQIKEDISFTKGNKTKTQLFFGTSEDMSSVADNSCDMCVTSPPYLNNFDYAEMTRMELYFWKYAEDWGGITQVVRSKQVVNTTTVPTSRKDKGQFKHNLPAKISKQLDKIVSALKEQQKTRAGKKDYHTLVYPYFSQMQTIISELHRVLKPGSVSHWVIGDSALYGVHIETDKILAEIMKEVGFEVVKNENLRKRGDRWILSKRQGASKGLGEFNLVTRKI